MSAGGTVTEALDGKELPVTLDSFRLPSLAIVLFLGEVLALPSLVLMVSGCRPPAPPKVRLAIEGVAKWYQLYRADHGNRPPRSEDEFLAFIQKKLESRGVAFDREKLLTSPRDGQRFVIQYGKPNSDFAEKNVAVYEKEGYSGKKFLAFESAYSREVDDAELQSLLRGQ